MLYSCVAVLALGDSLRRYTPADTNVVVAKDDYDGYDNCETPGDCAAPCASPQVFHVRMCDSHMCTLCAEPWCAESCQKLQAEYPTCRCPTWRDGKNTYSVSDIPPVDPDCLIGGVFSSAYEGGDEGAIPEHWRRYGQYGSTGLKSSEQKHCGEFSAKFEGGSWQLIENDARVTLEGGLEYAATFWAYGPGGQQIRTEFLKYNDDSSTNRGRMSTAGGSYVKTHTIGEADKWVKFTHTFTAGATGDVRMNIGIPSGGAVYLDDVSIARTQA